MKKNVRKLNKALKGEITIPSDKSISHRAVIFSSLAKGKSIIKNFSKGQDPLSSLEICKMLGVNYEFKNDNLIINSSGKPKAPSNDLDCGNSGTTMRFMCGLLAGQNFDSILIGDESLSKRPMKRVIEPLTLMGAKIESNDFKSPLKIFGQNLHAIDYTSKLASAQVKSCILLAGMNCEDQTTFTEPYLSRNHTELMLKYMGAEIEAAKQLSSHAAKGSGKWKMESEKSDNFQFSTFNFQPAKGLSFQFTTKISKSTLHPKTIKIPGDISSAALFIVAGLIVPNSEIILKNVGLNPTRTGILDVVQKMGGNIEILDKRNISGEDVGDIRVSYSELKSCTVEGEIIPRLIDELPVIAVLATQANGTTIIKDAQDLRNKETDRINAIVTELKKLGADIEETPDGFIINGKTNLTGGCEVETYHDHRLAMSLYVAGLICKNSIQINGFEWVNISFPEFEDLFELCKD
ncbi:3-phosphoshikimate 1-carboxyvinyltransferase [bacterium]|nr:3-phosphoshikimate 1-carboxyvinyltransferase [bacterium]